MKIIDKLTKVNEDFTVHVYDNGCLFEIGGQDRSEEWATAKIMVSTVEDLLELVREAWSMPRNN